MNLLKLATIYDTLDEIMEKEREVLHTSWSASERHQYATDNLKKLATIQKEVKTLMQKEIGGTEQ